MSDADHLIDLFHAATAHPPGPERDRFLASCCAGDAALQAQLVSLLQASDRAGADGFLPAPTSPRHPPPLTEKPGDRIGRYTLLEQIGEGGCGVVYMADQVEPVRRRVALKVIKVGMDTRSVIARFEAERQALALMDHPNIARVFDAGATDSGRPYFVMELVRGVKITDFCDQRNLSTAERLKLFVQVCHAIQHAHQKGVIHRDIKPSNVLVTVSDPGAAGCPKVIDFGIAKATADQPLTDKTVFTAFAQFIGTPAYMSPEQAMLTSQDVDTRSDIYALGVLLYELLTGRTPFEARALMDAGVDAMRRIIIEQEPARPSTRLSTLQADDKTAVARHRQAEPARLASELRGDLDWIVMKALEKDRTRRYDTATGLAMDLERHLQNEPVLARPPSAAYRFAKFTRRHRLGVGIGAAACVAVAATVAGLAASNRIISREKAEKQAALTRALAENDRADRNLAHAREAVKQYLLKTIEHPLLESGDFQSLRRELLETALPFYEEFVRQDPEDPVPDVERGRVFEDLGFLRDSLGDQERAAADFASAQGVYRELARRFPDEAVYRLRLAEAGNSRGGTLNELRRFEDAEAEFRAALAVVEPMAAEGAAAEPRAALARLQGNLGLLLRDQGRFAEAEAALQQATTTREQLLAAEPAAVPLRGQLATSWINLGTVLRELDKTEEAERAFERSLEILEAVPAPDRAPDARSRPAWLLQRAQAWNNLGALKNAGGQPEEAVAAFREALSAKESLVDTHPSIPQYRQDLAASLNNMGTALASLNRPAEAETSYQRAIGLYEKLAASFPSGTPYSMLLAGSQANLGRLIGDQGRLEDSLPWLNKSIALLEDAVRRDPQAAKPRETLSVASWTRAMTLAGLGRFPEALADWDRALAVSPPRYEAALRTKRASTLLQMNEPARAVQEAEAIAALPAVAATDLYNAACVHAVASGQDNQSPKRAAAWQAQAVSLLRRARAAGFGNLDSLESDADLDSLRDREDFQALLREWNTGAATPPAGQ